MKRPTIEVTNVSDEYVKIEWLTITGTVNSWNLEPQTTIKFYLDVLNREKLEQMVMKGIVTVEMIPAVPLSLAPKMPEVSRFELMEI